MLGKLSVLSLSMFLFRYLRSGFKTMKNNNSNNNITLVPSCTLKHNTIRCQMNVICKWASHDMWLDIEHAFAHRANCINRLMRSQIGRVFIFHFDLNRSVSRRFNLRLLFSLFHSILSENCKSFKALVRFATSMWNVVVKSLEQPSFDRGAHVCVLVWPVSISIVHACKQFAGGA